MGQPSSGSSGRPGVPTWGREMADYLFDSDEGPAPLRSGVDAMLGNLNPQMIFPMIASIFGPAMQGGAFQRQMAAGLTNNAVNSTSGIADKSAGAAGASSPQMDLLNSLIPAMFGAATDFAGNINQAEGGAFKPAMAAGAQSLQNVMDPTHYNPLFQNAAANITPEINADWSSKGLGSSGGASASLSSAYSGLADKFAERQFAEQLGAQQSLANTGTQFANTGIQGAQLPGQVYGQFMSGLGTGMNALAGSNLANQQAFGVAGQNQLMPLQAMGLGANQFWQGIENPMNVLGQGFSMGQQPLETALGGLAGIMGGITTPHQGWLGKVLGK